MFQGEKPDVISDEAVLWLSTVPPLLERDPRFREALKNETDELMFADDTETAKAILGYYAARGPPFLVSLS
jgi:hypothetical protein